MSTNAMPKVIQAALLCLFVGTQNVVLFGQSDGPSSDADLWDVRFGRANHVPRDRVSSQEYIVGVEVLGVDGFTILALGTSDKVIASYLGISNDGQDLCMFEPSSTATAEGYRTFGIRRLGDSAIAVWLERDKEPGGPSAVVHMLDFRYGTSSPLPCDASLWPIVDLLGPDVTRYARSKSPASSAGLSYRPFVENRSVVLPLSDEAIWSTGLETISGCTEWVAGGSGSAAFVVGRYLRNRWWEIQGWELEKSADAVWKLAGDELETRLGGYLREITPLTRRPTREGSILLLATHSVKMQDTVVQVDVSSGRLMRLTHLGVSDRCEVIVPIASDDGRFGFIKDS